MGCSPSLHHHQEPSRKIKDVLIINLNNMKYKFLSVFALAAVLLLGSCMVEEVPVAEHTILAVMEND